MYAYEARILTKHAIFNKILKTIELFARLGQFACIETNLKKDHIEYLENLGYNVSFRTQDLKNKYYKIEW